MRSSKLSLSSLCSLLIASILLVSSIGCARTVVEPGKVGIKVNQYGSGKGVEDYPLTTGIVWYNPFTESVYEYPTFMQNAVWAKQGVNGVNESVTFNSVEGSGITADVGIAYQIEAEKVPHIFVKFRQDAEYLTHVYMRQKVRDALNEHASVMKVTDIFGVGKTKLLEAVKKDLKDELAPEGFHIDTISFTSKFEVDPQVEASINATITASQKAIEADNKVKQIEAEAKQAVAKAKGQAESITAMAIAQAEANKTLAQSLTPELVQYEALQKWDGRLPQVSGTGATPFIQINPAKPRAEQQ